MIVNFTELRIRFKSFIINIIIILFIHTRQQICKCVFISRSIHISAKRELR